MRACMGKGGTTIQQFIHCMRARACQSTMYDSSCAVIGCIENLENDDGTVREYETTTTHIYLSSPFGRRKLAGTSSTVSMPGRKKQLSVVLAGAGAEGFRTRCGVALYSSFVQRCVSWPICTTT